MRRQEPHETAAAAGTTQQASHSLHFLQHGVATGQFPKKSEASAGEPPSRLMGQDCLFAGSKKWETEAPGLIPPAGFSWWLWSANLHGAEG